MARVALWARVSTGEQDAGNQLSVLREWARRRGDEVVAEHVLEESAWNGQHRARLRELTAGAKRGDYEVVLTWALDRLSREGPLDTLQLVDRLARSGCQVASHQEPWVEVSGDLRDLLLSITAWVARMESARRSERVRAGLERRRAQGLPVGRQPGAKDRRQRRRSGYFERWERTRT